MDWAEEGFWEIIRHRDEWKKKKRQYPTETKKAGFLGLLQVCLAGTFPENLRNFLERKNDAVQGENKRKSVSHKRMKITDSLNSLAACFSNKVVSTRCCKWKVQFSPQQKIIKKPQQQRPKPRQLTILEYTAKANNNNNFHRLVGQFAQFLFLILFFFLFYHYYLYLFKIKNKK